MLFFFFMQELQKHFFIVFVIFHIKHNLYNHLSVLTL